MNASAVVRWSTLAVILSIATSSATTQAQDLDEQEPRAVVQNVVMATFDLDESNFETWVFGTSLRVNGAFANPNAIHSNWMAAARTRLDSLLTTSIQEIDRMCTLSEAQRKKLLLAGHGDIKRFLDRVAEARQVFEEYRHDQNGVNKIYQETRPLAATLAEGLFGTKSFFSKTIANTLEPQQASLYQNAVRDKILFRHQARLRLAITSLDNSIGFTAEQRQRLSELAIAEIKPARNPGGQYEPQVLLLRISKLPEDKLRPIFDEKAWQVLNQRFQQAKRMEPFLKSNGFLDTAEITIETFVKPIEFKNK